MQRQAIILAAGRARRLGRLKALVPVGGEPLVKRLCRQLGDRDIPVTVITGYRADEVEAALAGPGVGFVRNPIAADSDLGWSCGIGLRAVDADEILVVLGDTVTDGTLFDRVLEIPGELVLAWVDVPVDDESMKLRVDDEGRPLRMSKWLAPPPPLAGEFCGVMVVRGRAREVLARAIEDRDPQRDLCEGPLNAVFGALDCRSVDCTGLRWTEIDFPEDIVAMEELFVDAGEKR